MIKPISQRGLALPTVIGVMVVLVVLGTALWRMGMADALQSYRIERRVQAEYIARSGAEALARYLASHPEEVGDILGMPSDPVALGKGEFTVVVWPSPGGFVIESTGTVGDVSQTVRLGLSALSLEDVAMYGNQITVVGIPTVDTNPDQAVYSSQEVDVAAMAHWDQIFTQDPIIEDRDYPDPEFPDDEGEFHQLPDPYTGQEVIDQDSKTGQVRLRGTDVMSVELGDSVDGVVRLLVDEFSARGSTRVELDGKGTLMIYVREGFDGGGVSFISSNWEEQWVIIVAEGDTDINLAGTPEFQGLVYAPGSTVTLAGDSIYRGVLVADEINIQGSGSANAKFEYMEISLGALRDVGLSIGHWLR